MAASKTNNNQGVTRVFEYAYKCKISTRFILFMTLVAHEKQILTIKELN